MSIVARHGWVLLLLASCATSSAQPGASSAASRDALEPLRCSRPLADTCGPVRRRFSELPSTTGSHEETSDSAPPEAGQMTERAAQGKRLFDQERWTEAIVVLEGVARGHSHDDLGNRQLAEYQLAIAFSRVGDWNAAVELFAAIAARRAHLKYNESLLWLAKAVSGPCITRGVVRALVEYDVRPRFENSQQKELFATVRLARARGLIDLGRSREAEHELRSLLDDPVHADAARECLEHTAGSRR